MSEVAGADDCRVAVRVRERVAEQVAIFPATQMERFELRLGIIFGIARIFESRPRNRAHGEMPSAKIPMETLLVSA